VIIASVGDRRLHAAIPYFGGKAFERLGEGLAQPARNAFLGLCDWAGDQISQMAKKAATGS
jgi:hypothetical protein